MTPAKNLVQWIMFPYVWLRYGSPVKADETVVLFPQSASIKPANVTALAEEVPTDIKARNWHIPIHAWVVEKEEGTASRLLGKYSILSLLGLTNVVSRLTATPVFENRLSWFMADREINKKIWVSLAGEKTQSPRSRPNGHIRFAINYSGPAADGSVLTYTLTELPAGYRPVTGRVQLVPEHGVSVISDIDDTIKISNVTSKRDLVRGLFFDEYHPAPGMAEFYHWLAKRDVLFHYVSASPWQLYPSLAPFMDKYFPFGCLSQRHFYIGDRSFIKFFRSSMQYKIRTVEGIIKRYPGRVFVLIGDSGEKDPEVYASVAAKYPKKISNILIREVYDAEALKFTDHDDRWEHLRSGLADHQNLVVFHEPSELVRFKESVETHLQEAML